MPVIEATNEHQNDIPGLSPKEMREHRGAMNPPKSIDPKTRPKFLQIQADYYQEAINKTRAIMNEIDSSSNVDDMGEYIELQERVTGLETARNEVLE